jgi:hypothetical protein
MGLPSAFALEPGAQIINRAAVSFVVRGGTHVVEDTDVLVASADAGNSPPHGVTHDGGAVAENSPGARIGRLAGMDIDSGEMFSFATDDPRFLISSDELFLAPGQSFDFERENQVTVQVRVTDSRGGTLTGALTINVLDVNEPPFDLRIDATGIPADTTGALIGTVGALDPDNGDQLTYSVDDPRFVVRGGNLRLAENQRLGLNESVELVITATDRGGLSTTTRITLRTVRVMNPAATPAELEFLVPSGTDAPTEYFRSGRCTQGAAGQGPFQYGGQVLSLPTRLPARRGAVYAQGDSLFLRLSDPDQNFDATVAEEIRMTVRSARDEVTLILTETGPDTGTFTGLITTTGAAPDAGTCRLAVLPGELIEAEYTDPDDPTDRTTGDARIAHLLRVWASDTGQPVDGVEVTLVDAATGQPAQGAISGLSDAALPPQMRSGATVRDRSGGVWIPPAGGVLLPELATGQYRIVVTPTSEMRFPTGFEDTRLAQVSQDRYRIGIGSRGETFNVNATQGIDFDVPLDRVDEDVFLTKEASTTVVEAGDRVQYRIRIQAAVSTLSGAAVIDRLPDGFRYEYGSARLDGQVIEPVIGADGQSLEFRLDPASGRSPGLLTYVTMATVAVREGRARNSARLVGPHIPVGVAAFADVAVRSSMLTDRSFLTGRIVDSCEDVASGVANVRVLLEDGTFALSDGTGRFHFEDLAAGTHVVRLDESTLPAGLETHVCAGTNRLDKNGGSHFVDLRRGSIGRVDFVVAKAPPPVTAWSTRIESGVYAGGAILRLHLRTGQLATDGGSVGFIVPDEWSPLPGSVRLDGSPLGDPVDIAGALTLKLPPLEADRAHVLSLRVQVKPEGMGVPAEAGPRDATVRALVTLSTSTGKHRSAPLVHHTRVLPADDAGVLPAHNSTGVASLPVELVLRGELKTQSMPLPVEEAADHAAYELPPIDNGSAPKYTLEWLRTQEKAPAIIFPADDYNPRIPAVPIVIRHPSELRPVVRVDGRLVDPVAFEGTLTDPATGLTLSRWKDVPVSERESAIEVRFLAGDNESGPRLTRTVHFGQAPVRAELVPEHSYLLADGVNPPMLAVRLFDRAGKPARPGLTGEFNVNAPFAALDKSEHLEVTRAGASTRSWQVRKDGIAFVQLEPTTRTGDVVLSMILSGQKEEKVRARLKPGAQDLIVVGVADSVIGRGAGIDPNGASEGRVAFYAKGMVRNDWQVTAAVDTARDRDRSRHREVDPGQFYPLYGDGSEQRYDAVSQRRFYFKAEKEQVEVEAGDFNTGLERSELARYERILNGVRFAWHGRGVRLEGFASDSGETHVQDVLRGDGTSGQYRLKRAPLIAGTEMVTLVTRDRLHTDRVLERQTLMRYLDYTIDYDRGTLLFKQPVLSSDNQFNPRYIEVSYDVQGASGGKDLVTGARVSMHTPDQASEAGVTVLRDDAAGAALSLNAVDLHWRLAAGTTVNVEAAQSRSDSVRAAQAYIANIDHRGEKLGGQIYFRQQEADFGVGLSPVTEIDTRKFGAEGEYRLTDAMLLRAQVFRQETLQQGGQRDVAGVEGRYTSGSTVYRTALQSVREQAVTGENLASDLLGVGVARTFFDGRLGLRADSDVNLRSGPGSASYPDRTVIGAEYMLDDAVTLLLEQELSSGGYASARQTRLGVRTRPWTGNSMESWVGQEMTENGPRLFSNTGLVQQWQVSTHWLIDAGMDQVKTLKGADRSDVSATQPGYPTFNPSATPIAGSDGTDFTSWFAGATLRRDVWHVSTRIERHSGDLQDKWNWLFGAARELEEGKALSASGAVFTEQGKTSSGMPVSLKDQAALLTQGGNEGSSRRGVQLRFGMAWRPDQSAWSVFNRLDLNLETVRANGWNTRQQSIVENLHLNWRHGRHEAGLQAGLRYAHSQFDSGDYGGYSALAGAQYRFDLNPYWDLGAHVRSLRSFDAGVTEWNTGVEVGRSFGRKVWISAGWNFSGFADEEFAAADYTRQGPYLKFRMRFDEHTVRQYLGFITAERRVDRGLMVSR